MIDLFKSWISSMLAIGIFVTFITLIIPKTKIRKYIYALIGMVTVFTIVSPIIKNINNQNLELALDKALDNVSVFSSEEKYEIDEYKNLGEDLVKKEFTENLRKDITSKLLLKNITVNNVTVFLTEEYNIEKIEVRIKRFKEGNNLENVNKVSQFINQEYDIDFTKITVIEEE